MSEEQREQEIAEQLATYVTYFYSGDTKTSEGVEDYEKTVGEIVESLEKFFPHLKREEFNNILENIEKKVSPYKMRPAPKISDKHLELVNEAYKVYEERKLTVEKNLRDNIRLPSIVSIFSLFILKLLLEFNAQL